MAYKKSLKVLNGLPQERFKWLTTKSLNGLPQDVLMACEYVGVCVPLLMVPPGQSDTEGYTNDCKDMLMSEYHQCVCVG